MNAAWVVCLKECRESLRDRRVLLNALILGPLLGPLLFTGLLRATIGRELAQAEQPLAVVVIGAQHAPNLMVALQQQGLRMLPPIDDPEAAVRAQRIELALRIPDTYEANWNASRPAQVDIIFDSSRRDGGSSLQRLRGMLDYYGRRTGAMRLMLRGVSPTIGSALLVNSRDQATPQSRGALLFALLPYFLVLTSLMGGMWLAIDSTAGERERMSLEPLLATPVPRSRILLGKLGATALFSFSSLVLGLSAFALAAHFLPAQQLDMTLNLGPGVMARILPLMIPLVLLIVITQMVVAAFAKSYREAQTYLGLLQLLPLIPSVLLGVLPITPKLWMYATPLIGQQLSITRLLRGDPVSVSSVVLCSAVTLLAAALVFVCARRIYESERLAVNA